MPNPDHLAKRILDLTPEEKAGLATRLAKDRALVDAIVRGSHLREIIDLLLEGFSVVARFPHAWALREELAYRKRQRDRKPDPETVKRDDAIRAERAHGNTLGQL